VTRLRPLVAVAVLAALVAAGPARASNLEDQLGDVSSRIDRLAAQADSAAASRPGLVNELVAARDRLAAEVVDLDATRQALGEIQADHAAARSELAGVRADLKAAYDRLATTRSELGNAREAAGTWARELYMGSGQASIGLAFGAAEMTQMLVGLEYLHTVAADGDRALLRYESLQIQEERERDRIGEQERQVAAAVAALAASEAQLSELEADHARRVDTIESEVAALGSRLDTLDDDIATFEGGSRRSSPKKRRTTEPLRPSWCGPCPGRSRPRSVRGCIRSWGPRGCIPGSTCVLPGEIRWGPRRPAG